MKKIIRLTESDLIKLVKKVIKEQNTNTLDSDAMILNGNSEVQIQDAEQYNAKYGVGNGFGGIEYTQPSNIKSVTNYYDGKSTISKRNDVKGSVTPNEFTLNTNFTYTLEPNEVKNVGFIYSKDGKEIFRSDNFTLKGTNKKTVGLVHLTTIITKPGKYTLTNTLDKNYWLEIVAK